MRIRRYYDRHVPTKVHKWFPKASDIDEYLQKMGELGYGVEDALAMDTAQQEIVLSKEEQVSWYFDCLRRVFEDPGFYLDNIDGLVEFRVNITNIFANKISDNKKSL